MQLRIKLPLVFTAALLLLLTAALFGIWKLQAVAQNYEQVLDRNMALERRIGDTLNAFKTQAQEWKNVLLRGHDAQQRTRYWQAFEAQEAAVHRQATELAAHLPAGEARQSMQAFAKAHQEMGQAYRKGFAAFEESGFDPTTGDAAVQGIDRSSVQLLDASADMVKQLSEQMSEAAQQQAQRAQWLSLISMLLVFATGLAVAIVFSRSIARSLQQAVDVAQAVASGDLTRATPHAGRDEMGQLFNALHAMQQSLDEVVRRVRGNAEAVAHTSAEIAQGNGDLSRRTESQASALEQTAASMEQLASTVSMNSQNAQLASRAADEAQGIAQQSGQAMQDIVQTMQGISSASQQIADIIGVIDSIAFQTNILALNAAVEAARAGEQGRGFAVVATEVRGLAQRTAESAKQIKTLISNSVERVGQGSQLINQAGHTARQMVESILHVSTLVKDISTASIEQNDGVQQVSQAVMQMDQAVQQNAALVEQSAAAAEALSNQSQGLVQTVAVFQLQPVAGDARAQRLPAMKKAPGPGALLLEEMAV
ncbi:methyl-accepting chemotaxis protein [Comamonas composti]|uniref:methyl-accepting chemotaxis protein n=1 Tax=Comamonas composti TaxID=408558 RepID=UPI000414008E|nr:methyl-accepting chemotaxis protein [Comamonas composti]